MKKVLFIILVIATVQWWFSDPSITTNVQGVSFNYIVKYSEEGGDSDRLPMLVALHGNGDTPENFYKTALDQLQKPVRIILIEGPVAYGRGHAWPWQQPDLDKFGMALNDAVNQLALKYPTDDKPSLLGFSGGGMMAYYQALQHGNSYATVFSVSGQLNEQLINNKIEPAETVFAYHGTNDSVISISGGRNAVSLLQSHGVTVFFTEFSGTHHGLFTNMKSEITRAIEQRIFGRLPDSQ